MSPVVFQALINNVLRDTLNCFVFVPKIPSLQFVVEVDASDSRTGAVLSQRDTATHRLHPCAFFSHHLYPAERNYDVGNQELLDVVWALQELMEALAGGLLASFHHLDRLEEPHIQLTTSTRVT